MFDRHTHVDASSRGPSRVDVHEHKAPTADSVRLLSEMERKVMERVIRSQPVEAAHVRGSITHILTAYLGGSELHVSFSIGGKREDVKVALKEEFALSAKEYAQYMAIEVSIAIAVKLLVECEDVRGLVENRFQG